MIFRSLSNLNDLLIINFQGFGVGCFNASVPCEHLVLSLEGSLCCSVWHRYILFCLHSVLNVEGSHNSFLLSDHPVIKTIIIVST